MSIPAGLMAHFGSQYGAKSIVQEYVAAMVATLRINKDSMVPLGIFLKFLTQVPTLVLMFVPGLAPPAQQSPWARTRPPSAVAARA